MRRPRHFRRAPPLASSGSSERRSSLEMAVAAVRATVALGAATPVTGFSLADLSAMERGALRAMSVQRLRDAGLGAVADVPIDLLPDPAVSRRRGRAAGLESAAG